VKKNNLTRSAFALLLLASTAAGADQQYPAADFQPEVLYQDSDYIAKNSPSATTAKAAAPTPKAAPSAAASHEADSKYPAADFQPEVLYHDPNYKPSQSVKATASKEEIASKQVESVASAAVKKEESSMSSYLIGLVVLALAGFYFFKKSQYHYSSEKSTSSSACKSILCTDNWCRKVLKQGVRDWRFKVP